MPETQTVVTVQGIRDRAETLSSKRGYDGCFVVDPPLKVVCIRAITSGDTIQVKVGDVVEMRLFGQRGRFGGKITTNKTSEWQNMVDFRFE